MTLVTNSPSRILRTSRRSILPAGVRRVRWGSSCCALLAWQRSTPGSRPQGAQSSLLREPPYGWPSSWLASEADRASWAHVIAGVRHLVDYVTTGVLDSDRIAGVVELHCVQPDAHCLSAGKCPAQALTAAGGVASATGSTCLRPRAHDASLLRCLPYYPCAPAASSPAPRLASCCGGPPYPPA